jgi:hypothetical protein
MFGIPGFGSADTWLMYPCEGPATGTADPDIVVANDAATKGS